MVSWPLLAEVEPTFPCDFYPWREKAFVKCLVDEQHKMGWWRRFINDIVFQDFSAQTPLRGFLSNMFENHHHNNPGAQAKGSKDHNTKKVKLLDIHSNPPNGPSQTGSGSQNPPPLSGGNIASTKGPGDAIINGASEGPGGQIWSLLNAVMIWLDITKLSLMMYFSYQIVPFHQLEWLSFSQIWANDASIWETRR